jgi:hypothetical protein
LRQMGRKSASTGARANNTYIKDTAWHLTSLKSDAIIIQKPIMPGDSVASPSLFAQVSECQFVFNLRSYFFRPVCQFNITV